MLRGSNVARSRGVTLAEVVIGVAILTLLTAMTLVSFRSVNAKKALETDAARVVSELNTARSLSIGSKNRAQFGVRFETGQYTRFQGSVYAVAATNTVTALNPNVMVLSTSLSDGGPDVIFERLTGKAHEAGTITLALRSSTTTKKTVTIYTTGLSEVQ